jgi:hypothetical protein
MLKSVLIFSIAVACMYTLDASPQSNQHLNLRALLNTKNELSVAHVEDSKNKDENLCETCLQFFKVLKDVVGDLTKNTLTNALNVSFLRLDCI